MKRSEYWLGLTMMAAVLTAACGGSSAPDVRRGEDLYNARCWNCHEKSTPAMGSLPGHGPGLKDYLRRSPHQDIAGVQHEHTDEFIRHIIRNGSKNMPPQNENMPDRDLADLVAYVKTL